jgi:hypothetical protein
VGLEVAVAIIQEIYQVEVDAGMTVTITIKDILEAEQVTGTQL